MTRSLPAAASTTGPPVPSGPDPLWTWDRPLPIGTPVGSSVGVSRVATRGVATGRRRRRLGRAARRPWARSAMCALMVAFVLSGAMVAGFLLG